MTEQPQTPDFILVCPDCKKEVGTPYGKPDDTGVQFYRCVSCVHPVVPIKKEITFENKFAIDFFKQIEKHPEMNVPSEPLKSYPNFDQFIPRDDDGKPLGFKPALVAQWLKEHEHFKTERKTDILYYYDGKKWQQDGETYLKELVANILEKENHESHYRNIKHHLTSITLEAITWSQKIACENGLLDVEKLELTDFNPDEMPFYSIPVVYDPKAKCPLFEKFIREVLNPEDVQTIKEFSGFLLLADYREHKILWCFGSGRNGKGCWTRTMEGILGEDNCSSIGLEEFDGKHRFAVANLYGSLFNACNEPEVGYKKILQTNLLKAATGQDTLTAELKNKQKRVKFRNKAKIVVVANRFPKVEDNTTAFKERRIFITFPHEYIREKKIQNIEKTWLENPEERSGILNWMLGGLHHLLTQGYFTESKSQDETETLFLRASDPYDAFVKEQGILNKTAVTPRSIAFQQFQEYCDYIGITLDKNALDNLTRKLKNTKGVLDSSKRIEGKKQRCWVGISFKPVPDNEIGTDGTANGYDYPLATFDHLKIEGGKSGVPTVPSVPSVPDPAEQPDFEEQSEAPEES